MLASSHSESRAVLGHRLPFPSIAARRRGGALPDVNLAAVANLLPVVLYVVVRHAAGTQIGIGVAFLALIVVFALNRRRGVMGGIALLSLIIATGASVAGILLNSDIAFLLRDPIGDFLTAGVILGSLALRRPLLGLVAREVSPRFVGGVDLQCRLFYLLTLLWAGQILATGGVRVFLFLQGLAPDSYIVWSRAASWPAGLAVIVVTGVLLVRAGRRTGSEPSQPAAA